VALAAAGGEDATLRLLAAVVEIDDPATGTVRLRADAGAAAETALSTRTVRLRAG
jgi:hypothetical protein